MRSSLGSGSETTELRELLGQLLDPNLGYPSQPVFVSDLDIFEMPDGLGFQFRGPENPVLLRGRQVGPVVRYLRGSLDGAKTVEDLLRGAPSDIPATALVRTLLLLHGKGVLTSAPTASSNGPPNELAPAVDGTLARQLLYWGRHLAITRSASSSEEVARRLATARVVLVGSGLFGAVTADLLARSGFGQLQLLAWNDDGLMASTAGHATVTPSEFNCLPTTAIDPALDVLRCWLDTADLLVTATCDAPNALFEGINDLALGCRVPWLYGNADGSAIDLGPLVQPYESACYLCLGLRRRSAEGLAVESELYDGRLAAERDSRERVLLGEAVWPATLAASMLAGEACRFVTGLAPATLTDTVLKVMPVTGGMQQNHFARVPRCPACYRGAIPAADLGRSDLRFDEPSG